MATSFKKATASGRSTHPRGTRPSLHNAQPHVSTGVPSLDALLGGGLAVGTVLLVEEDVHGSYARLLLKYFLSEGVMCGHALFLASTSEKPADTFKDLPGAVGDECDSQPALPTLREGEEEEEEEEGGGGDGEMEIAWRYQNLPKVQSSFSTQFGHSFDLTTRLEASRIAAVKVTTFDAVERLASSSSELYSDLVSAIHQEIELGNHSMEATTSQQRNVLRIGLQSLGSPLWLEEGKEAATHHSLPSHPHTFTLHQFLHSLRAMLRSSCAVAIVTIPTHLMQNMVCVRRLERLCDGVVRLESFAGSDKEQSPLYKEYHGLLHLHKLPRVHSLTSHFPETLDLAFKLKRKKFSIEKLHLPPELSESASRTQEEGPLPGQREKTSLQGHGGARIAVGGEGQPQSRATTTSSIRTATKFKVDF